jgi:uncharacterized protein
VSFTLDTNILLYASDESSPFHNQARELVENVAAGPEIVYLFWPVVLGYLRIATHPAVFEHPLAPAEAISNVDALLSRPHVRAAGELEGFWPIYRSVADAVAPRGNLVTDAHIAALMRQHGVARIWSLDRDFRKFDGISVFNPFR